MLEMLQIDRGEQNARDPQNAQDARNAQNAQNASGCCKMTEMHPMRYSLGIPRAR